jgi:hypothetical protein
VLAARPATDARTWGYRRAEVLAAAAQAAVLLAVGGFVLVEGVKRLFEPPDVASGAMVVFDIVGLLGNAVSILILTRISSGNLNTRAALPEVINDALGSIAVLVAAAVIALTGWHRADALASLLIGVMILPRTRIIGGVRRRPYRTPRAASKLLSVTQEARTSDGNWSALAASVRPSLAGSELQARVIVVRHVPLFAASSLSYRAGDMWGTAFGQITGAASNFAVTNTARVRALIPEYGRMRRLEGFTRLSRGQRLNG